MKVIKKINNNVAVCLDSKSRELIAFGKGIGFPNVPYELNDLSKIDRTFYSIKDSYLLLLNEINEKLLNETASFLDYCRKKLPYEINETLYFVIADHLNFAIKRATQNIYLQTGLTYEVKSYYPEEYEIALEFLEKLNKEFNVKMLKDEAANIAMHIVENENRNKENNTNPINEETIEDITSIIEEYFEIKINKSSFNYSRFVSHVQYLLLRRKDKISVISDNDKLYETIKKEYPKTYNCVLKIKDYFKDRLNWMISDEEMLYLMLHINRMRYREDCNQ